ncbi:hypothetical protein M3084_07850 [Succinatimonas hippei]|nr:hypothetical protein [Succinatimonas hippei]MCL1603760.1 hypothetical protein [Succinatimonas hippei]
MYTVLFSSGIIVQEKHVNEIIRLEGLMEALKRQIDHDDPMVKIVVKP